VIPAKPVITLAIVAINAIMFAIIAIIVIGTVTLLVMDATHAMAHAKCVMVIAI
jgi:hypothetical protein